MKKIKLLGIIFCLFLVVGCSNTSNNEDVEEDKEDGEETVYVIEDTEYSSEEIVLRQDQEENNVEVIMSTSMGDIHLILYEDVAPLAVENFVSLAESGYYDGVTFHRVIDEFMIQAGDPTGTGSGGESTWGETFINEYDTSARHIYGSLAMANSGEDTNGSQFFIVDCKDGIDEDSLEDYYYQTYASVLVDAALLRLADKYEALSSDEFEIYYTAEEDKLTADLADGVPEDFKASMAAIIEAYDTLGGASWLDDSYTVFGYVIDGMDVVEAISEVETDDSDKPTTNVIINSITIIE